MKKKMIEWKSFLLGVLICLGLILFTGAVKPGTSDGQVSIKKAKSPSEAAMGVSTNSIETRLDAIEKKLASIDQKQDKIIKDVNDMWRELYNMVKK